MDQKAYTLDEISQWVENDSVEIPQVQRGFVWKPYQIENLWDSLLRGYPIGAIVLAYKKNQKIYQILDGQQRTTSICLGFGSKTFRNTGDKIKIFIDLEKPKTGDVRKYIFRVITKSHPWGYRKIDNTKPLTVDNIRKSMNLYGIEEYLDTSLDQFYPYDASLPVPLHFFLDAAKLNPEKPELLFEKIFSWSKWNEIKSNWLDSSTNKSRNDQDVQLQIIQLFEDVKKMLKSQCMPALYLPDELINSPDNDADITEIKPDDELDDNDEIENLFIRLNAGGTPLRGEELNYSILKSHISKELQNKIEYDTKSLFTPARFVTISYRLFQNQQGDEQRDSRTMRIRPKQFQKAIYDSKNEFQIFLNSIFSDKPYNGLTLLEYVVYLLKYQPNHNPYGLPFLIVSKISNEAPEIMFILLYRIINKRDRFNPIQEEQHKNMLGMLTLFLWLGKGEKNKDHAKLLTDIWENVKNTKSTDQFWGAQTISLALKGNNLVLFPPKKSIRNQLSRHTNDANQQYYLFISKIIFNKDLLLYAQREFLANEFKDEQYSLDDTNVPFDWDHICPYKLIHKKHIPDSLKSLKQIYNSNGNFRAWPYSLNRMDQDDTPALKLNPLTKTVNETKKEMWEKFIKNNKNGVSSKKDLSRALIKWSFCDGWQKCEITNLKRDGHLLIKLITTRNFRLIQEWYDNLHIDKLI